jgi:hypothetical protein
VFLPMSAAVTTRHESDVELTAWDNLLVSISVVSWSRKLAAIAAVLLLAGAAAYLAFGRSNGTGNGAAPPASPELAAAKAKANAGTAFIALEQFAYDHGSAYAGLPPEPSQGVTVADLRSIEPSIPAGTKVVVTDEGEGIAVSTGQGGSTFGILRSSKGGISRVCEIPGQGVCPLSGDWADMPQTGEFNSLDQVLTPIGATSVADRDVREQRAAQLARDGGAKAAVAAIYLRQAEMIRDLQAQARAKGQPVPFLTADEISAEIDALGR